MFESRLSHRIVSYRVVSRRIASHRSEEEQCVASSANAEGRGGTSVQVLFATRRDVSCSAELLSSN